jgi:hypothetical protein
MKILKNINNKKYKQQKLINVNLFFLFQNATLSIYHSRNNTNLQNPIN